MTHDHSLALLELMLPEGILNDFIIVGYHQGDSGKHVYNKTLTIDLEEKKIIPEAYKNHTYKACGFTEPRIIEDYPIRNMLVSLRVRRRRWEVVIDGKKLKVSRDLNIIAPGTRMSAEYAAFLKEID